MLHNSNFWLSSGVLSLTHFFSIIFENIAINHMLPPSGFFGLHFCCGQFRFNLNQFDVTAPIADKSGQITLNNSHYAV